MTPKKNQLYRQTNTLCQTNMEFVSFAFRDFLFRVKITWICEHGKLYTHPPLIVASLGRQTRNLPVLCSMVHVAMGICLGLAIFAFHALCPLPWQFLSPQTNNEFVCFVFQVLVVRNNFLSLAALFFSVLSFDGSIPRQWSSEFVSFAFREFLLRMNIKTTRLAETRSRQGTRKFYNV